jgi:hypothetical protein
VSRGLICRIPLALRIGSETALAPLSSSPRYAIVWRSSTAVRALRSTSAGDQRPVRGSALSSGR